jgi:3',5'-cyclic AMP phosphodiesterase CpdA
MPDPSETTLLHVSDVHCGPPFLARTADALLDAARAIAPDAVVVSGDLVQRADFIAQWEAARAFLARLPRPLVVIPGNHDIPLWNPLARLLRPYVRYRAYVGEDLEPVLDVPPRPGTSAPGAHVVGVATPRRFLFDGGFVGAASLEGAARRLGAAPAGALRVVALHHPLLPQREAGYFRHHVYGHRRAVRALAAAGAEVLLSGHNHYPRASTLESVAPEGRAVIIAQAGTATSRRLRPWTGCATQAVNVVRARRAEVVVEPWLFDAARGAFAPGAATRFARTRAPVT